jgi:hypothetical protein
MLESLRTLLEGVGTWAWHLGLGLFLFLNAVAILAVVVTRDRALVDRWAGRWLAANLALLGLGAGVPVVAGLLRLGIGLLPDLGNTVVTLPK